MSASRTRESTYQDIAPALMMVFILGLIIVVISNALFFSDTPEIVIQSSTGTANFDAVTATAHAERVSRSAEWTIASVLTLGTALIGLNWYTSHRNYRDEQERIAKEEVEFRERIVAFEQGVNDRSSLRFEGVEGALDVLKAELAEIRGIVGANHDAVSEALALDMERTFSRITSVPSSNWKGDLTNVATLLFTLRSFDQLSQTPRVTAAVDRMISQLIQRFEERWGFDATRFIDLWQGYLLESATVESRRHASKKVADQWTRFASQFIVDKDQGTEPSDDA